ncbi:hypothetical protein, partial [Salinispora arenicola]|uniref:hypothetical protein n=1 Tax=Salinispora arenicola TaxID=168697 RepID=UPI001E5DAA12
GPDALDGHELWRSLVGQSLDLTVERCDLGRELLVSGGEGLERQLAGRLDPGDRAGARDPSTTTGLLPSVTEAHSDRRLPATSNR